MDNSSLNNPPKRVLVESYINGANWYNLYSDGWLEQGGESGQWTGTSQNQTANLLKSYSDTNYDVLTTYTQVYTGYNSCAVVKSTNNFVYGGYSSAAKAINWYACGYAA